MIGCAHPRTSCCTCQVGLQQPAEHPDCLDYCSQGNADNSADAVRSQHLIALLVADAAAIGIWRNGALLRHRVLTGYTVRKQQGKAQQAYQRQGGGEADSPHTKAAHSAGEHGTSGQSGSPGYHWQALLCIIDQVQCIFDQHSRAVQVSL